MESDELETDRKTEIASEVRHLTKNGISKDF